MQPQAPVAQSSKKIPHARIAILQAKWHSEYTDLMIEACREMLAKAECTNIEVHQVPGAYELPLAAKLLAKSGNYDAICIFGVVVKGDTDHYQVIVETCIRELGKVMYDYEVPVIMELMPVHDIRHVAERSSGKANKGIEAGNAAIEMIAWKNSFSPAGNGGSADNVRLSRKVPL